MLSFILNRPYRVYHINFNLIIKIIINTDKQLITTIALLQNMQHFIAALKVVELVVIKYKREGQYVLDFAAS